MTVRDQLQAIHDEFGTLTPELVVEAARNPENPLHNRAQWHWDDDALAAEKWRLEVAGQLLRVVYKPDPKRPTELRAFIALQGEGTRRSVYTPIEEVAADPFLSALAERSMRRDWEIFKARYQHHKAFFDFVRRQIEGETA